MPKIKVREFKDKPRTGKFAEKNGAYEQVLKLSTPIIDSGDTVTIEQFFTGYGEISAHKITFFPSDKIFNSESYISYGFTEVEGEGEEDIVKFVFGLNKSMFDGIGVTFELGGLKSEGWDDETIFFDESDNSTRQIATEVQHVEAPVKYVLKTKKTIKPGKYSLEFNFIYYNGESWKSSQRVIHFHVRNFLEKYSVLIGTIAITASLSAIVRLAAIPLWNILQEVNYDELLCVFHFPT